MNSHDDDGSIPGLPSTYPLDPSLTADLSHHHPDLSHDHAHDLDADVSLAADYFAAAEDGGELSLNDANMNSRVEGVPMLPGEQELVHPLPPKSRKRKLQLACHFCRRRKLKCDGARPTCDNCEKRNETCEWDDNVRRRGPGKRTKVLRDRAADEAAGAGFHEATGNGSKHMDPNGYNADTASSVADTNAALIAAVTAAAAEGAGGMDDSFGNGELASGQDGYGEHQHHHEDVGEESADIVAHLQEVASAADGSHGIDPLDPNIDPSLSELGPSTLADASNPTLSLPPQSHQHQHQHQHQHHHTITQLEQQQLQAAIQLQRQEHLLHQQQHQQQQRKMGGVGVGVGSSGQIQTPSFGVLQAPLGFGLPHLSNGTAGGVADGSVADVNGGLDADGELSVADGLDWDKGYNFSAWPDLDLGGTTH